VETFSRETLDSHWVTGFADAVASFTYSRSGKQLSLYFAIKLSVVDQLLLEQIRDFFRVGKLYVVRPSITGRALTYFRVSHRHDLIRILEHFDAYPLQTSKQRIYEIWRDMVLAKQNFRSPDHTALALLAKELSRRVDRT